MDSRVLFFFIIIIIFLCIQKLYRLKDLCLVKAISSLFIVISKKYFL